MNEVIGLNLNASVGIAVSPFPIIGLLLALFSTHPARNGIAYMLGSVLSLLIPLVVGMNSHVKTTVTGGSRGINWVNIGIGVLMLLLAFNSWRGRPRPGHPPVSPPWMAKLEHASALESAGIGLLLGLVNVKNLPLNLSAGTVIAGGHLSGPQQFLALLAYTLVGTITVTLPLLAFLVARDKVEPSLMRFKDWLVANNSVIMTIVFLMLGARIIGQGLVSS